MAAKRPTTRAYYLRAGDKWINAGDTLEAAVAMQAKLRVTQQYERSRKQYERATGTSLPSQAAAGTPWAVAADNYFNKLVVQGRDAKTLRAYHGAIDPFLARCNKPWVELSRTRIWSTTSRSCASSKLRSKPVPIIALAAMRTPSGRSRTNLATWRSS